jgi:AcrR family transcriptional regulator
MPKTPLSRELIATVALDIADKEGFDAVSMRRIAQQMDVGTMSLYHYVSSKDELIAAMDDAIMGEALLETLPKGWRRAMTEIARRTHAVFIRHPWALFAMVSAPPGLNTMRHVEQCLEALDETALTTTQKFTLLAMVDDCVRQPRRRPSTGSSQRANSPLAHSLGSPRRLAAVMSKFTLLASSKAWAHCSTRWHRRRPASVQDDVRWVMEEVLSTCLQTTRSDGAYATSTSIGIRRSGHRRLTTPLRRQRSACFPPEDIARRRT